MDGRGLALGYVIRVAFLRFVVEVKMIIIKPTQPGGEAHETLLLFVGFDINRAKNH